MRREKGRRCGMLLVHGWVALDLVELAGHEAVSMGVNVLAVSYSCWEKDNLWGPLLILSRGRCGSISMEPILLDMCCLFLVGCVTFSKHLVF